MDQERDALDERIISNERIIFDELSSLHDSGMSEIIITNKLRKIKRFQLMQMGRLEVERSALVSRLDETNMLIETSRSDNIQTPNYPFGRDFDFNRESNTNQVVDPSETADEDTEEYFVRNVNFCEDILSNTLTSNGRCTLNGILYESNRSNEINETEECVNKGIEIPQFDDNNNVEMSVGADEVITEDRRRNVAERIDLTESDDEERIDLTQSDDEEMDCNQSGDINLFDPSDNLSEIIHQAINPDEFFHERFDVRNRHEVTN